MGPIATEHQFPCQTLAGRLVPSGVSRYCTHKFLLCLLSPRWVGDEMAEVVENGWLQHKNQNRSLWDAVKAWQSRPAASAGDSSQGPDIHPNVVWAACGSSARDNIR